MSELIRGGLKLLKKYFSYFGLILMIFSSVRDVFAITTTPDEAGKPKVTITAPQQISQGDWVNLDIGVTNSNLQTNSKGKVEVTVPKTIVSNSTELLNSMEIGAPFSTANTSVREDSQGNYVFDVDYDSSTISGGNTTSNFRVKFIAHLPEDTSLKTVDFKASFVQDGTVNNTSSASSTIFISNELKSESSSELKSESSSELKSESSSDLKSRSSDSPKVSLQTPKEIGSNDLVKLSVLLGASNGELPKDGLITVKIPKVIVRNKNDLINLAGIGLPFAWADPAITEEGDDYVLNIRYSAEEINQDEATAYTINLAFQAPLFYQGAQYSHIPDNLEFSVKVTDGDTINLEDSKTVPVIKKAEPALKTFDKLGKIPTDSVNGIKTYKLKPTFSENIFNLTVNYKGEPHKNVVVSDQLPDDAYLVDAKKYLPATGDMTSIGHIRIVAVSSRDESGNPNGWKYVTSEFKDKITFTKNSFSINFGDLAQGEGYAVEYAVGTDNLDAFGVQYNTGKMSYDGYKEDVVKAPMTVYNPEYSRMGLLKNVDKTLAAPTDTELEYSLKLTSYSTEIPAGTVITDKLTSSLKFKELVDFDQTKLEDFSYDEGKNTITYRTKVPVKPGETIPMSFKASIVSQLKKGDTIANTAFFNFNGSTLASNRVVTVVNGQVNLVKIDDETLAPLSGAVFTLQDEQGKPLQEGLTSDTDGVVSVNNLKPGKYQLVETQAPDGYELDTTPVKFTIVANQSDPIRLVKTNNIKRGSVVLTKVDDDSRTPLRKAVFTLQDEQGNPVREGLESDAKGKITINDLRPGKYKLVETQSPDGYELDATPVEFEIVKNQQTAVEVEKTNTLKPGSVVLTKVDADSKAALENAVFTLQDEQGNPLQEGLTTGTDGKLTINDLKPGKYQLVETQAPDGYELDATPVEFEIVKNQQTAVEVEKTNTLKPGSVVLTKVDADSKSPLENAVFTLQDEQGNPLQEGLTTGTDGKLTINDLKPGKYQLVETQAPDGYELDATPVEFEIVKNQQTAVEVEKTNTQIPNTPEKKPVTPGNSKGETPNKKDKIVETNKNTSKDLPSTGEEATKILSIFGLGILVILGVYLKRKSKY